MSKHFCKNVNFNQSRDLSAATKMLLSDLIREARKRSGALLADGDIRHFIERVRADYPFLKSVPLRAVRFGVLRLGRASFLQLVENNQSPYYFREELNKATSRK